MKKINIILFVLFLATGFKTVNPVASAALKVVDNSVIYDSSYVKLKYPGGDVPANRGVCADPKSRLVL